MKFVRTHQSLIAWMLYGFILFSGLVCSLSHGQMLRAFNQLSVSLACSDHPGRSGSANATQMGMAQMDSTQIDGTQMDMAQMSDHAQLMKLSMADCTFAGSLVMALVLFIGLTWQPRSSGKCLRRCDSRLRKAPRHSSPGLSPRAP